MKRCRYCGKDIILVEGNWTHSDKHQIGRTFYCSDDNMRAAPFTKSELIAQYIQHIKK